MRLKSRATSKKQTAAKQSKSFKRQFLVIMIRFQHRILIYCVIISVVVYKVKVLLIRSNTSTYVRSYEDQYVRTLTTSKPAQLNLYAISMLQDCN